MTSVTGNPQTPGSYYEAHNQSVQDEKTDDKKKLASRGNANPGGPPSPDVNIGKTESGSHSNAGTPKPLSGDAQTALPRASDKDIKSLKEMGLMKPEIPADHKLEEITKNSLFEGFKAALSDTEIERFKEKMGGDWEDKNIPAEKRVVWAENSLKKLKEFDSEGGKESVANNGKIEGLARQIPLLPEFFLNSKNYTVAGSEGRKLGDFASDRQPEVLPADRKLEDITKNSLFEWFKAALSDTEIERFKEKMGGDWEDKNIPAEKRVVWAENALKKLKEFDSEGGKESVANNGEIEGLARHIPLLPEFFLNSKNYTVAGSEERKLGDFASDRQPDVSS